MPVVCYARLYITSPSHTPNFILLPCSFILRLIRKLAPQRLQPRMPIIVPNIRATHPPLARKCRSTMHDPPIIDDHHRPRVQLYPILRVGALDRFFPLGSGIIPCFHVLRSPAFTEYAAVLVVPFHLNQFAGDGVMLEHWLSEGTEQSAIRSRSMGWNGETRKSRICVWVKGFQDRCGVECIDEERGASFAWWRMG